MSNTILLTAINSSTTQWKEYSPQTFNLTDFSGNPVTISLDDIHAWAYYTRVESVLYGLAIGLSSIFLIALAVHDRAKLCRPIFLLNILSLTLVSLRGIVGSILLTGPFAGMAQIFLGAPARYGAVAEGLFFVFVVVQAALYSAIVATLTLQVLVVFSATPRTRRVITIILSVAGTLLVALQLVEGVFDIMGSFTGQLTPQWVITTFKIFFPSFVGLCSLIFLFKLALSISQRRNAGITKFGPLQILFITSCQCLVVPRISMF